MLEPVSDLIVRRITPEEQAAVHAFVQAMVDETYASVWPSGAPPIDATEWSNGWLAEREEQTVAVMLTGKDWLDDLWVNANHWGLGVGTMLLAKAESEIADRGFAIGRLRIVAGNDRALRFYLKHGWTFHDQQAHQRLPISMITLVKDLRGYSAAKQ